MKKRDIIKQANRPGQKVKIKPNARGSYASHTFDNGDYFSVSGEIGSQTLWVGPPPARRLYRIIHK